MTRDKAVAYIRKNKAENFEDAKIRKALENAGWPQQEIDLAFIEARSRASSTHIGESLNRKDEVLEPAMGGAIFGQGNLVVENMWKRKGEAPLATTLAKRGSVLTRMVKKVILIVFGILILGGAIAGGVWYYTTELAPNSLRTSAISNLREVKQIGYDLRITLRVHGDNKNVSIYSIPFMPQFAGLFTSVLEPAKDNIDEIKKIEIDSKRVADWRDSVNARASTVSTLDMTEYLGNSFKYESRRFGDSFYFQLSGLPEHIRTVFGFDLAEVSTSTFSDTWVHADAKTIVAVYGSFIDSIKPIDSALEVYIAESAGAANQAISLPSDDLAYLSKKLGAVRWGKETFQETIGGESATRYKGVGDTEFLSALGGSMSDIRLKKLREALGASFVAEINMWVEKSSGKILQISVHAVPTDTQISGLVEFTALMSFGDSVNFDELVEPIGARAIEDAGASINRSLYRGFEASRVKARDIIRTTDLEKIRQSLSLYFDMHKRYPDTLTILVPEFLAVLPKDPLTQKNYQYKKIGTKDFTLLAQFEIKK